MPSRWKSRVWRFNASDACSRQARRIDTGRHIGFLRAQLAVDVQLDRQTVTVVAGNIGRVVAHHRARLDDEVFQDLVHRRAEMDVGIGVGWAIVQDELLARRSGPRRINS